MPQRKHKPEEIVAKLRQVDVLLSQGRPVADAIRATPGLQLVPNEVETNLVWFEIDPALGSSTDLAKRLQDRNILVHNSYSTILRACTHLDVSTQQAEYVAETIRAVAR